MHKRKSQVESEVIAALSAKGGSATSAYQLIVIDLGRSWYHGWRCLGNLERRGVITCERNAPKPMVIRLVRHDK